MYGKEKFWAALYAVMAAHPGVLLNIHNMFGLCAVWEFGVVIEKVKKTATRKHGDILSQRLNSCCFIC